MSDCPVCQLGVLHEWLRPLERSTKVQCTNYPRCRFEAQDWDSLNTAAARFHHPIAPGQV